MASPAFPAAYSPRPRWASQSGVTTHRQAKSPGARTFSAIERMEDEVRALEGMAGRSRLARWIFGILILGALLGVGSYFYLVAK